jgi:hypothetical protein
VQTNVTLYKHAKSGKLHDRRCRHVHIEDTRTWIPYTVVDFEAFDALQYDERDFCVGALKSDYRRHLYDQSDEAQQAYMQAEDVFVNQGYRMGTLASALELFTRHYYATSAEGRELLRDRARALRAAMATLNADEAVKP